MTGADLLTYSRLLLGPLVFLLLVRGESLAALWAAALLAGLGDLTDLLDGIVARRTGVSSDTGKVADPFTDSFFRLSVYLGLVVRAQLPAWMFLLLLYRDLSNAFLRQLAALQGTALAARWSGKVKALLLAIASYVLIFDLMYGFATARVRWWGSLGVTLWAVGSGLDYLWANRRALGARGA